MVPLASRVRLLAVVSRHQHAAILRTVNTPRRRRRRRPDSICKGQSRHRRLPPDKPANAHDGPGAAANNLQRRSPKQAVNPGADTWSEPPLLLYRHQLPQDGARGEHADEPAQAGVD